MKLLFFILIASSISNVFSFDILNAPAGCKASDVILDTFKDIKDNISPFKSDRELDRYRRKYGHCLSDKKSEKDCKRFNYCLSKKELMRDLTPRLKTTLKLAAKKFGYPYAMAYCLTMVESRFDPGAASGKRDTSPRGLTQIQGATQKDLEENFKGTSDKQYKACLPGKFKKSEEAFCHRIRFKHKLSKKWREIKSELQRLKPPHLSKNFSAYSERTINFKLKNARKGGKTYQKYKKIKDRGEFSLYYKTIKNWKNSRGKTVSKKFYQYDPHFSLVGSFGVMEAKIREVEYRFREQKLKLNRNNLTDLQVVMASYNRGTGKKVGQALKGCVSKGKIIPGCLKKALKRQMDSSVYKKEFAKYKNYHAKVKSLSKKKNKTAEEVKLLSKYKTLRDQALKKKNRSYSSFRASEEPYNYLVGISNCTARGNYNRILPRDNPYFGLKNDRSCSQRRKRVKHLYSEFKN